MHNKSLQRMALTSAALTRQGQVAPPLSSNVIRQRNNKTTMNKVYLAILTTIMLSSCTNMQSYDPRLEGAWISNKDMTMAKIGDTSNLSREKIEYLENNLGELQFVFKGNKTAVFLTSQPKYEPEFESYRITAINENSISIKTSRGVEATYYLQDNCFYLINSNWGYKEYFCNNLK